MNKLIYIYVNFWFPQSKNGNSKEPNKFLLISNDSKKKEFLIQVLKYDNI